MAASCGQLELVRLLIEAGADIALETRGGVTAVHVADSEGHVEVVGLLVAAGARRSKVRRCQ